MDKEVEQRFNDIEKKVAKLEVQVPVQRTNTRIIGLTVFFLIMTVINLSSKLDSFTSIINQYLHQLIALKDAVL